MKKKLIACVMLATMSLNLNMYNAQTKVVNNNDDKQIVTNATNPGEDISFSVVDPDDEDID